MKADNELIAEFMNKVLYDDWVAVDGKLPSGLRYDTSWDWLMPVVEKIEKDFNGFVLIHNSKCVINPGNLVKVGDSKIDAVYKAVVEFITNSQTQH